MNVQKSLLFFAVLSIGVGLANGQDHDIGQEILLQKQNTFSGHIADANTGAPLPWVNIGIAGKDVGTVSQEDGSFELNLNKEHLEDSISLSYIGYRSITLDIPNFTSLLEEHSKIELTELPQTLSNVTVKASKLKQKTYGHHSESHSSVTGFVNDALGNELGTYIRIKNVPALLESFQCYIPSSTFETASFRLNVYNVEGGMPGEKLNKENIIVETSLKRGKLTVDLTEYQIHVDGDIIVSLEWIKDLGSGHLNFSTSLANNDIYYRKASMGTWKKASAGAIGFNVNILH